MDTKDFALGKQNLILIGIAFAVNYSGVCFNGRSRFNSEHYNPDIFSFRRIVLAPGIAFAGFVFMIYAIMKKSK